MRRVITNNENMWRIITSIVGVAERREILSELASLSKSEKCGMQKCRGAAKMPTKMGRNFDGQLALAAAGRRQTSEMLNFSEMPELSITLHQHRRIIAECEYLYRHRYARRYQNVACLQSVPAIS